MRLSLSMVVASLADTSSTVVQFESLTPDGPMPYPFFDLSTKNIRRAVVLVWKAHRVIHQPHCVVLAYDPDGDPTHPFVVWCGDGFLEDKPDCHGRDRDLIDMVQRQGGDVDAVTIAVRQLAKRVRTIAAAEPFCGCKFWRAKSCHHVEGLWQAVRESGITSRVLVDQLAGAFHRFFGRGDRVGRVLRSPQHILTTTAFRRPVLLLGPRGAGKTSLARDFARTVNAVYIEAGGHEGVESVDLFGSPVIGPLGRWVWKDGPLSEAFRRAERGERVVLCIDELLRIPVRHQSALLTALSPDHPSGDHGLPTYRLRTGRMVDAADDVGVEETLRAPCNGLAIVATSNIGADYHVSDLDPAIAGRFKLVEMTTTRDALDVALRTTARIRGLPEAAARALLAFFDEATAHYAPDSRDVLRLRILPCVRTLTAVLHLADTVTDIPLLLREEFPQWTTRDLSGDLNASELSLLDMLATKAVDHLAVDPPVPQPRATAA